MSPNTTLSINSQKDKERTPLLHPIVLKDHDIVLNIDLSNALIANAVSRQRSAQVTLPLWDVSVWTGDCVGGDRGGRVGVGVAG